MHRRRAGRQGRLPYSILLALTLAVGAADLPSADTEDIPSGNVVVSVPRAYLGSPAFFNTGFSISIPSMAPVKDRRHNDFREERANDDRTGVDTGDRVMVVSLCHYTDARAADEVCRGDDPDRAVLMNFDSERWPEAMSGRVSAPTDPEVVGLTTGDTPLIRTFRHPTLPKAPDAVFGRSDCSDGACRIHYIYQCPSGPPFPPFRICRGPFQDRRTGVRGDLRFIHVDPETADKAIEATISLLRSWTHAR